MFILYGNVFPRGDDEREDHLNLVKELRLAFEGETKISKLPRLLLTLSVPAAEEAVKEG
jgi:chitinase